MSALNGRLMRLCGGVALVKSMGPGRRSLRVAARARAFTSATVAASLLITPGGFSKISKAALKQLGSLKLDTQTVVEEPREAAEVQPASEEFNLEVPSPKLDGIKKKLNFGPKLLVAKDLKRERTISGSFRARKMRAKFKAETADDTFKEAPAVAGLRSTMLASDQNHHRPALPRAVKVKIEDEREEEAKDDIVNLVKQESRGKVGQRRSNSKSKASAAGSGKAAEGQEGRPGIDVTVKIEPPDEAAPRKRKQQSNGSARLSKVKAEEAPRKEAKTQFHAAVKQEPPEEVGQRKRKLPKPISARATPLKQEEDGLKGPRPRKAPRKQPPQLDLVRVGPVTGAQLASESVSGIILLPGPYPSYARPFPEECQQAKDLLSGLHGQLPEYERHKISCPTIEQPVFVQAVPALGSSISGRTTSGSQAPGNNGNLQLALTLTASSKQDGRPKHVVPTGRPRKKGAVLDSLIGTLLSQNTTDNNSRKAFGALKSAFPTWEKVLRADPKEVVNTIRCGGLAEIKAERIRTILSTLSKERGEISMEYLRSMSNDEIKAELSRFKGVGPKTVACVLMFHLQRNEFPVDTHVFRISKMLGWVPEQADREKAYLHLNQRIPDSLKFDIHCLFVTHGKRCPKCAKRINQQPADGDCPLLNWTSKWSKFSNSPLELISV